MAIRSTVKETRVLPSTKSVSRSAVVCVCAGFYRAMLRTALTESAFCPKLEAALVEDNPMAEGIINHFFDRLITASKPRPHSIT